MQQEAERWLAKGIITEAEYQRVVEAYPDKLYRPNVFIRIGLFLLTVLIIACGLSLLVLITDIKSAGGIGMIFICWGIIASFALEIFIRQWHIYQAGVDDALLWAAVGLVFEGISLLAEDLSGTWNSAIIMVLAAWGIWRYADRFMTFVAYSAMISLVFNLVIVHGPSGTAAIPFVVMGISVMAWFLFTRLHGRASLRHYHACLSVSKVAALLSFYLAGNYYVVQHLNAVRWDPVFHRHWSRSALGTLSWLWWTFTILTPLYYVMTGLRKKDAMLIWTGLALTIASVVTVRYYYHILSTELAMILGGSISMVVAYVVIHYLKTPKLGFTSARPDDPHPLKSMPIEALLVAETFKSIPGQPIDQAPRFGGGSGGGAGAGGTY